MAIREEKYIDITSGLGGRSQLTRRSLSGRVFTTSPAISNRGIVTFRSPTEVMEYFGVASKEYQFAVKYFGFVSKSMTTPAQLSFAGWGTASEQKSWDKYKAVINSPVSVTVTREADGKESYYLNIQSALEAIGDYAIIDITLNTDLCYIHPYDCEYHDDSDNVFGMGERIYESLMSVTGMDDLNKTEDWKLLNGLTVRKTQTVSFDLNGHIFGGYYHCFVNYGSLSIYDTVGDGRAFTTNLNKYVLTEDGKKIPHSSRREDVVSSKTIQTRLWHRANMSPPTAFTSHATLAKPSATTANAPSTAVGTVLRNAPLPRGSMKPHGATPSPHTTIRFSPSTRATSLAFLTTRKGRNLRRCPASTRSTASLGI